jgi:hypothetical protein
MMLGSGTATGSAANVTAVQSVKSGVTKSDPTKRIFCCDFITYLPVLGAAVPSVNYLSPTFVGLAGEQVL